MRYVLALLLCLIFCAPAFAGTDARLQTQLQSMVDAYSGKVALYATDLRSGKSIAIDADRPVPTASVIKLTILFEALKQIEEGKVRLDDRVTLTKAGQVPGSGVLSLFDTPLTLTLKDALTMMVVVSDNSGTNLVIDRLGLTAIDDRIAWMGLQNTWLYKKVFEPATGPEPADQKQFGLGKTTAREMAAVMTRFANCDLDAPGSHTPPTAQDRQVCAVALGMLKDQEDRSGIPRYLDPHLVVANKTGADDPIRNDVAIVYASNGPIVISVFTYDNTDRSWSDDNAAHLLTANLAKQIVTTWQ
ncbi:MAG TPA: serine hydrolase [Candidatus Baltobacteraceae bacterium]